MTAPELPLAAELRHAAAGVGQGQTPPAHLLREAADELTKLRRELDAWREAHHAALELIDQQGEAVELLREVHGVWAVDPVGSAIPAELAVRITKTLLAVDRPEGER
jgi:hypothetical protein